MIAAALHEGARLAECRRARAASGTAAARRIAAREQQPSPVGCPLRDGVFRQGGGERRPGPPHLRRDARDDRTPPADPRRQTQHVEISGLLAAQIEALVGEDEAYKAQRRALALLDQGSILAVRSKPPATSGTSAKTFVDSNRLIYAHDVDQDAAVQSGGTPGRRNLHALVPFEPEAGATSARAVPDRGRGRH